MRNDRRPQTAIEQYLTYVLGRGQNGPCTGTVVWAEMGTPVTFWADVRGRPMTGVMHTGDVRKSGFASLFDTYQWNAGMVFMGLFAPAAQPQVSGSQPVKAVPGEPIPGGSSPSLSLSGAPLPGLSLPGEPIPGGSPPGRSQSVDPSTSRQSRGKYTMRLPTIGENRRRRRGLGHNDGDTPTESSSEAPASSTEHEI
ncbi:MAG: hypothetical protein M1833_002986 [Piccolia ochrophora]|nr:MAG: hypothetical protein M1833_002986 [Piccolia ochrophora]